MLNARIRKRWRAGNFPIGLIGEKADLTYTYDYLGAGPRDARRCRAPLVRRRAPQSRKAAGHRRRGGVARPDGAAIASLAAKAAVELGAVSRAGTALACCTAPRRASARSIWVSCRARAARRARQMAAPGTLDVVFLLGADEIDIAPGAFVVYIGSHGDRGAPRADVILPGAAYPEKSGDLRQHRRPRADGDARLVPARRCARGLGDPARVVGRAAASGCLTIRSRHCARRCSRLIRISSARPDRAGRCRRHRRSSRRVGGAVERTPFRVQRRGFLFHQRDRARSAVMAECSALARRARGHDGG